MNAQTYNDSLLMVGLVAPFCLLLAIPSPSPAALVRFNFIDSLTSFCRFTMVFATLWSSSLSSSAPSSVISRMGPYAGASSFSLFVERNFATCSSSLTFCRSCTILVDANMDLLLKIDRLTFFAKALTNALMRF